MLDRLEFEIKPKDDQRQMGWPAAREIETRREERAMRSWQFVTAPIKYPQQDSSDKSVLRDGYYPCTLYTSTGVSDPA